MATVPEDLRCKRSDGKQWRCSAPSMPDKTVCEKHYVQAKKRSASSALRASLRRSASGAVAGFAFPAAASSSYADADPPMAVARPFYGRVAGEAVYVAEPVPARRAPYDGLPLGDTAGSRAAAELVGRSSTAWLPGGGAAGTISCHQCRNVGDVIWCTSCDRRGYCTGCLSKWYLDIPVDDIQKVCPACRGICNCRVCLQGDNLIKARVQEIPAVDKLRYLHSLLVCVLPLLKQIYSDQCFEIGVETRSSGPKTDILRAKMNSDEEMCCDFCKVPVLDYHRHCPRCLYDLCLYCCRDIRHSRPNIVKGEHTEGCIEDTSKDSFFKRAKLELSAENVHDKSFFWPIDLNYLDIRSLFPTWKVSNDGSITCGPHEAGGCGSSRMVLRRIFKINWIAKLVKCSEEMVNSCKVHDLEDGCPCCGDGSTLDLTGQQNFDLLKCSNSDGIIENRLYSPLLENLKYAGISHFRKHWIKGEPIIIRKAFEPSLSSSWDPLSIWRGIQEIMDEKMDEDVRVKAVDCSNQSEVNIELKQFIKGYSDGKIWRDGHSMLKLKEWPQPSVLEEFLLCQRPEFIVNFPLIDFIHPRWGLLNLAAKLPLDALQHEVGMKLLIAQGSRQELGKGDSVTNLTINMGDVVHMLMHTTEGYNLSSESIKTERPEGIANGTNMHAHAHAPGDILDLDMEEQAPIHTIPKSYDEGHASMLRIQDNSGSECASAGLSSSPRSMETTSVSSLGTQPGALWDVFCRHDIPKLNEYLVAHWEELSASSQAVPSVKHAIYDQAVYLSNNHKRILKDHYGIEPWTFHQRIGEAVFIPAGCPFQVKNLQMNSDPAFGGAAFPMCKSVRSSTRDVRRTKGGVLGGRWRHEKHPSPRSQGRPNPRWGSRSGRPGRSTATAYGHRRPSPQWGPPGQGDRRRPPLASEPAMGSAWPAGRSTATGIGVRAHDEEHAAREVDGNLHRRPSPRWGACRQPGCVRAPPCPVYSGARRLGASRRPSSVRIPRFPSSFRVNDREFKKKKEEKMIEPLPLARSSGHTLLAALARGSGARATAPRSKPKRSRRVHSRKDAPSYRCCRPRAEASLAHYGWHQQQRGGVLLYSSYYGLRK